MCLVVNKISFCIKMKNNSIDGQWSVFSLAMELGYTIAIPIVLLALGGKLLDKKLDSAPWFLLLGIFISVVLTSWLIYKKMVKIINEI